MQLITASIDSTTLTAFRLGFPTKTVATAELGVVTILPSGSKLDHWAGSLISNRLRYLHLRSFL